MGPRAGLDRCGKSRPHRDSIPDRPARSQSLYLLSYTGPFVVMTGEIPCIFECAYNHNLSFYGYCIFYENKRLNKNIV